MQSLPRLARAAVPLGPSAGILARAGGPGAAAATQRALASAQAEAPRFATAEVTRRAPKDRRNPCSPYSAPGERPQYPKRRAARSRATALIDALHREEAARLVAEGRAVVPARAPGLTTGDIARVEHVPDPARPQFTQFFTGLCMGVRRKGLGSSFTLRNVVDGVPVERSWPTYSPLIKDIVITGHKEYNRSKLYYLREKPIRESTFGSATQRPKAPSA